MDNRNASAATMNRARTDETNNEEALSRYAHCVLPAHFFDLMLAKQARDEEEEETQVIEVIRPKNTLPRC